MKLPFRLPFSLPELNLSELFNFTGRELRIIIIGVSSVLICAVIITALVAGLGKKDEGRQAASAGSAFLTAPVQETAAPASERPFLSDFILPDDEMEERFTEAVTYREPMTFWSDDQVQQFWIDMDVIAEDLMEMEAVKVIRDIFADVQ